MVHLVFRCDLWYNKSIFRAGDGRMVIHTMNAEQLWYNTQQNSFIDRG